MKRFIVLLSVLLSLSLHHAIGLEKQQEQQEEPWAYAVAAGDRRILQPGEQLQPFPGIAALMGAQVPYPVPRRGIMIVGNRLQLANVYVTLKILRERLNCTLPVEIVHHGEKELPRPELHAALTSLKDVTLVDSFTAQVPPQLALTKEEKTVDKLNYYIKTFALAFVGSFTEVLMLDADNLPLIDPRQLFETKQYKQHGNLFWPDWWWAATQRWGSLTLDTKLYDMLGVQVPKERFHCAESGQVLIDRVRHRDMLLSLWWLARQNKITSKYIGGDKDLYRIAFGLARKASAFQQVEFAPRNALSMGPGVLKFMGMVQMHPEHGGLAFHHRTWIAKYFPGHSSSLDTLDAARHWHLHEVDVNAWQTKDCSYTEGQEDRPRDVPEAWCNKKDEGQGIATFPLDKFGQAGQTLDAHHALLMKSIRENPALFECIGECPHGGQGR